MDISALFSNINKIIERESKTSTYKFALLRGVIEIIQDSSPYIKLEEERVEIPTGLMIEKWLLYYYPIISVLKKIYQINQSTQLAFEPLLGQLIAFYLDKGGLSAFYRDLRDKGIPFEILDTFQALLKTMQNTITGMPMKHIGQSINKAHYSVFQYSPAQRKRKHQTCDIESLILYYGTFTIPRDYYEVFRLLGSFINGQDSILMKWAQLSVSLSNKQLEAETVLQHLLTSPVNERDVQASSAMFQAIMKAEGKVYCIWTGKTVSQYDIDHLIPFSAWRNNDLWNLLPTQCTINNKKRDKIPTPSLIEDQRNLLLHYWVLFEQRYPERFRKEIQTSLLGIHDYSTWQTTAIEQLKANCQYLIEKRGYEPWTL